MNVLLAEYLSIHPPFQILHTCLTSAKRPDLESRCSLPIEVGLCEGRERKWFFNLTSNTCGEFNYTGCRGNDNRFDSVAECRQTCEPIRCAPVTCKMMCPFGWAKDNNGCEICQCVNPCEVIQIYCRNLTLSLLSLYRSLSPSPSLSLLPASLLSLSLYPTLSPSISTPLSLPLTLSLSLSLSLPLSLSLSPLSLVDICLHVMLYILTS